MWDLIARGFKAFSDAGNVKLGVEVLAQQLALESISKQIRLLEQNYFRDKSSSNKIAVRTHIDRISAYLNRVAWSGMTLLETPVGMIGSMGLGTKTLQVIWARELLLEIAYAEQNGSLPPSPTSWSVRRAGYLRQQRNFQALAREFGLAAANKDRVIKAIRAHQFTILRAATDEGASAADFEIYKEDMIEQVADEKLAMRYRDFFRRTSEASKMTAARFGAMVEAGDRQARVKR